MAAPPISKAEIRRIASFDDQPFERGTMKFSALSILAGLVLAAPVLAQSTGTPPSDPWRMPHERGFWGHAGVSFGQSKLDISCPAGFACDDKDQFLKAYAGGRFSNIFGLELGVMNFGKFQSGGGEMDGWGADASLVAGVPLGENSAIFAKAGVIYARTEVSATAPGVITGKERGFGGRWGVGAQLGLSKEWALRADFDRYRLALPGSHEDLEALTLGVQYTFR
jgi:OOP family OmpA-OmpF porin